jgi:anion-transporting  ArsA/GET3 family ATPase
VLRSPQTAVHMVTLLEEMPVQETLDAVEELTSLDLPVGGVVVNMVRTPALPPADLAAALAGGLDRAALAGELAAAGLSAPTALVDALAGEAADHAARVALEERGRDTLAELARPSYELPLLADAVDLGGLYELARMLCEQGMA